METGEYKMVKVLNTPKTWNIFDAFVYNDQTFLHSHTLCQHLCHPRGFHCQPGWPLILEKLENIWMCLYWGFFIGNCTWEKSLGSFPVQC